MRRFGEDANVRRLATRPMNHHQHKPMKTKIHIIAIATALCAHLHAADWEAMKRTPAQIEVIGMQPIPLVASDEKNGWAKSLLNSRNTERSCLCRPQRRTASPTSKSSQTVTYFSRATTTTKETPPANGGCKLISVKGGWPWSARPSGGGGVRRA